MDCTCCSFHSLEVFPKGWYIDLERKPQIILCPTCLLINERLNSVMLFMDNRIVDNKLKPYENIIMKQTSL